MKKRFFLGLAALAALALTSCQKDLVVNQVPDETPIGFSTYLGRDAVTKASVLDLDGLKTSGFGVFAHYTGTNTWGQPITNSDQTTSNFYTVPNFMYNQKVTGSDNTVTSGGTSTTTTTWSYSPVKYWPQNTSENISFFAYAPHSSSDVAKTKLSVSGNSKEGAPEVTYNVDPYIVNHVDVLYAPAHIDKTNATGTINLKFYHACSRIGFLIQGSGDLSGATLSNDGSTLTSGGTTVTVKELKLIGNFYTSGTLNLGSSTVTTTGESPNITTTQTTSWTATTPTSEQTFEILDNSKNLLSEHMFIIPQDFSENNSQNNSQNNGSVTISGNYTITTSDETLSGGSTPSITNYFSGTIKQKFENGKAYKIVLSVSPNAIKFNVVSVEGWGNEQTV